MNAGVSGVAGADGPRGCRATVPQSALCRESLVSIHCPEMYLSHNQHHHLPHCKEIKRHSDQMYNYKEMVCKTCMFMLFIQDINHLELDYCVCFFKSFTSDTVPSLDDSNRTYNLLITCSSLTIRTRLHPILKTLIGSNPNHPIKSVYTGKQTHV